MALGFFTTTSSIWLSCSGIESGLVGMYWSVLAFSVFAMLSAPTRTVWKNGLVWFLVKTAIVSPSARACVVAAVIRSDKARQRDIRCCMVFPSLVFFSLLISSLRWTPGLHVEPDCDDDDDSGDERLPVGADREQVHAVQHQRQDQRPDEGAEHGADAAKQRGAADQDRCDRGQRQALADV